MLDNIGNGPITERDYSLGGGNYLRLYGPAGGDLLLRRHRFAR